MAMYGSNGILSALRTMLAARQDPAIAIIDPDLEAEILKAFQALTRHIEEVIQSCGRELDPAVLLLLYEATYHARGLVRCLSGTPERGATLVSELDSATARRVLERCRGDVADAANYVNAAADFALRMGFADEDLRLRR